MDRRFRVVMSRTVTLAGDDVDTDQIIPARFLTTTTRHGLGAHLFADLRGAGQPAECLTRPETRARRVLVVGNNFGCGSSREHAPWALRDYGFRAVVGRSFADIFRRNALQCGLLPIELGPTEHAALAQSTGALVAIDLARSALVRPGGNAVPFRVDAFARTCLLQGVDALGWLLEHRSAIQTFEETRT
ncbi:MAG: 3-isopropylmalate dehydratase small subunit [Planctomycetota bacterium]